MEAHLEEAHPGQLLWPTPAARYLGINPATLQRWAREGLVPVVVSPAGARRYRRADLDKILRARKSA